MPVHLRPDEEPPAPARDIDARRDRDERIEGVGASVRAALNCLLVGAVLLAVGMRAMRPTLLAAESLLLRGGDYWREAVTPCVMFALYGGVFGCALGWRMAARATLTAGLMWAVGTASMLLLGAAGALAAVLIFPGGIPHTLWIDLALLVLAGLPGLYFTWNWGA